jgi:hypothetical protein
MNVAAENETIRHPSQDIDADVTTHDLLNDATEWLQYARGLIELLAELVHESDTFDCRRMALGLEGIGAMTRMGLRCTAQAHARMSWERARNADLPVS